MTTVQQVQDSVPPPLENNKLFVGGVSQQSTKESITAYFNQFGEVLDVNLMTDPATNKSRGFVFITFKNPSAVTDLLTGTQYHYVDGKKVEIKAAYVKGEEANVQAIIHDKKIFLGGLPQEADETTVKEYFKQFGEVIGVDLKRDKGTDHKRGFGFVDFATKEGVDKAIDRRYHDICSKQVEVKKAEPRGRTRPVAPYAPRGSYGTYGYRQGGGGGSGGGGVGNNWYQPYGGNYSYGGAGYANPYNYGRGGYSQQPQMGSFSHDVDYGQARPGYGGTGTETYSNGGYGGYDQTTYPYYDQSGNGAGYGRGSQPQRGFYHGHWNN